jgi:hypothetical protein
VAKNEFTEGDVKVRRVQTRTEERLILATHTTNDHNHRDDDASRLYHIE